MNIDKACAILKKTDDGNKLSPQDLSLLELAVNGWLSETGETAFEELYQKVIKGIYKPQWLNDVEHITRDHEGYVYWKGQQIEHYDSPWCYSKESRKATIELSQRCRHLEQIGVEANTRNVIWDWEKYENIKNRMEKDYEKNRMDSRE